MNSKIVSIAAALMMGFTFSAFADKSKDDSKATVENKVEILNDGQSTASSGTTLYWFDTNASGTELQDPTGIPSNEPQTQPQCDGNSSTHCQKGFTEGQTTVVDGRRLPNIPVSAGISARYD